MNSVLELATVLEVILRGAVDLLQARSGSIMLLEGDDSSPRASSGTTRRSRVG